MNTHFKLFASYNILQYLCDFIDVPIFVTVLKCWKSPKLTNIVIYARETNIVCECRCEVYMHSYMASSGSCFMVTWIIFKIYLLEVL